VERRDAAQGMWRALMAAGAFTAAQVPRAAVKASAADCWFG
jgi:hypothetical protein